MDATAVSALLDTGFEMDEATMATAFRALRWRRRRRPAPWDATQPLRTPSLSAGPRQPCPPSSTRASRWTMVWGLRLRLRLRLMKAAVENGCGGRLMRLMRLVCWQVRPRRWWLIRVGG